MLRALSPRHLSLLSRAPARRLSAPSGVCAAYCAPGALSLGAVATHFSTPATRVGAHAVAGAARAPAHAGDVLRVPLKCGSGAGSGTRAHAFFFRSGAVVIWGAPADVRRDVLARTPLFCGGRGVARMEEFEHEFAFYVGGRARFANDKIYVRGLGETDELLAVSYGLAQSVKLHVHEVALDGLVGKTERLPAELAAHGRISLRAGDIRKLIGELLSARYSVSLVSDILDIPEYLWRRPDLEGIYGECVAGVELKQRSRVLDARVAVVRDALDMLNGELATEASNRLERAILFLIFVEVLFEVARITGHT